jgi:hypothetical protein
MCIVYVYVHVIVYVHVYKIVYVHVTARTFSIIAWQTDTGVPERVVDYAPQQCAVVERTTASQKKLSTLACEPDCPRFALEAADCALPLDWAVAAVTPPDWMAALMRSFTRAILSGGTMALKTSGIVWCYTSSFVFMFFYTVSFVTMVCCTLFPWCVPHSWRVTHSVSLLWYVTHCFMVLYASCGIAVVLVSRGMQHDTCRTVHTVPLHALHTITYNV